MNPNVIDPYRKDMPMPNMEEAIRQRAYHLWSADGRPEGKAEYYWFSAQRDVMAPPLEKHDIPAAGHLDSVRAKVMTSNKTKVARSGKGKSRS